ncbi:MAG: 7-cyano-7-deazaguanine synthase [Fimbriimonadales bacterium]|nr:7-cyano-7-deazaguanine synthase [Fimbriimonadales bacterium]
MSKPKAIVLLSGGLDSATCLAIAKAEGLDIHALTFQYGQRHAREVSAAKRVAENFSVLSHHIISIDHLALAASSLTGEGEVPKNRTKIADFNDIPSTYVPARNTLFLSYALGMAEVSGTGEIYIGANAVDYSGYPDCRREFMDAFERMANRAIRDAVLGKLIVRIRTPLMNLSKAEIITLGNSLGVPYELTWSCYDPQGDLACGECDSCLIRLRGFEEAGLTDPIRYRAKSDAALGSE